MKKIHCILCYLTAITFCCSIFTACSDKKSNEELTASEKNFVGTWKLKDITYFTAKYNPSSKEFERIQLWYPSSSKTFNKLCEKYINKTYLIFDDIKTDSNISGTLKIDENCTEFSWYCDNSEYMVNFSASLTLSVYDDNEIRSGSVRYAMINSDGKLCLNPDLTMIYIFEKS